MVILIQLRVNLTYKLLNWCEVCIGKMMVELFTFLQVLSLLRTNVTNIPQYGPNKLGQ